jgi:hypothetical protein
MVKDEFPITADSRPVGQEYLFRLDTRTVHG